MDNQTKAPFGVFNVFDFDLQMAQVEAELERQKLDAICDRIVEQAEVRANIARNEWAAFEEGDLEPLYLAALDAVHFHL